jgi:hypothetical protein
MVSGKSGKTWKKVKNVSQLRCGNHVLASLIMAMKTIWCQDWTGTLNDSYILPLTCGMSRNCHNLLISFMILILKNELQKARTIQVGNRNEPQRKVKWYQFFPEETKPEGGFNRPSKYRRVILRGKALLCLSMAPTRGNGFNLQKRG